MKRIHLIWKGPFVFDQISEQNDETSGSGLYQIYGLHPIYGESLLYIGKTITSFKERLIKEEWHYIDNCNHIKYYLGFIAELSIKEDFKSIVDISEKLLILAHTPSCNSVNVKSNSDDFSEYQVYNWGSYNRLLPEISGDRYSSKYWNNSEKNWAVRTK